MSKEPGSDRGLQKELAAAYAKLGDVQGLPNNQNSGQDKAALLSYAKALSLYEDLAQAEPDDVTVLSEIARKCTSVAAAC